MAYLFNREEFAQNLAKGIEQSKFRDLLVKFGVITKEEYVKVYIKQNETIIGSCEVPLKENIQEPEENTQESLPSVNMHFQDVIMNEILKPNQATFDSLIKSSLGSEDTDSSQPNNIIDEEFSLTIEIGNPVLTRVEQIFTYICDGRCVSSSCCFVYRTSEPTS